MLAHSDIAPGRKTDPGEWFPWEALAARGTGLWVSPALIGPGPVMRRGDQGPDVEKLQRELAAFGYGVPLNGIYCEDTETVVAAFQRHWRPALVDGAADLSTVDSCAIGFHRQSLSPEFEKRPARHHRRRAAFSFYSAAACWSVAGS